jgi:hypothetical protein
MAEKFWIKHENQINGPFSLAEMRELVNSSKISQDDEISKDRKRWIVATCVRALKFANGQDNGETKHLKKTNDEYWVRHTDEAFGPYTLKELKSLARDGLIQMDDLLSTDRRQWSEASTSGGLPLSAWQSSTSNLIVYCPECGRPHAPGVIDCSNCNTCLRPTFLGVCTLIWFLFYSFSALGFLVRMQENLMAVFGLIVCIAGAFMSIGLRCGKYWGWIGMQIVWVVSVWFLLVWFFKENGVTGPNVFGAAVVIALGAFKLSPWWVYLHNERVKTFCSAGLQVE